MAGTAGGSSGSSWKHGNPGCCTCTSTCTQVVNVQGCGGLPLQNASVTVTGFGTATTDASGNCTFAGLTNGVNYSYTATHSSGRLAGISGTFTANCGTVTLTMNTATAGYTCSTFCALPLNNTLHLTDSIYGAFTLTWNATTGDWRTSGATINFPGCSGCPAVAGVPVIYTLAVGGSFGRYCMNSAGCPATTGAYATPEAALGTAAGAACPLSFSMSGAYSSAPNASQGYCANATITITE